MSSVHVKDFWKPDTLPFDIRVHEAIPSQIHWRGGESSKALLHVLCFHVNEDSVAVDVNALLPYSELPRLFDQLGPNPGVFETVFVLFAGTQLQRECGPLQL